ncbi:MAG: DUF7931 domain-containing protein [Gammaproteobacteria bacterium]
MEETSPEPLNLESTLNFESREELLSITSNILARTERNLNIVSRHLDPLIYDLPETIEAIKKIVLGNRQSKIRIVVTDIRPVLSGGHRLLELAQRLSSFVSVRVPGESHKNFNEAILIADSSAYVYRPFADRYEGEAHYQNRGRARDLNSRFDELWEKAQTHPGLRRLHI